MGREAGEQSAEAGQTVKCTRAAAGGPGRWTPAAAQGFCPSAAPALQVALRGRDHPQGPASRLHFPVRGAGDAAARCEAHVPTERQATYHDC